MYMKKNIFIPLSLSLTSLQMYKTVGNKKRKKRNQTCPSQGCAQVFLWGHFMEMVHNNATKWQPTRNKKERETGAQV